MIEYIPTFTDITDWNISVHQNTGGTRSKNIAIDPETNEQYFFKGSKETITGEIRYPEEFWSEIVASKIGANLGFRMLDYNIGYNENHSQKIGCISKSMIRTGENKLTEGQSYLVGHDSTYRPDLPTHKSSYSFQFICDALKGFRLEKYIHSIIETIIFDSIIGNSDRHQENWGIITNFKSGIKAALDSQDGQTKMRRRVEHSLQEFASYFLRSKERRQATLKKSELMLEAGVLPNDFAPIYDSGCCLGREMSDDKILKMNSDPQMLQAYLRKGQAEIHWNDAKKRNHFDLIRLIKTDHYDFVLSLIERTKQGYDSKMIEYIINNIDKELPNELFNCKLQDHRKKLMVKLVTLRVHSLFDIL